MWRTDIYGSKEFAGGKESWSAAVCAARDCTSFVTDVEEEMVAEEERSCYNCRYRRWSMSTFTCQSPGASVPGH